LFFLDMKKRMNEVTYMMFNVHEWAW
jgi:hypothetical protein